MGILRRKVPHHYIPIHSDNIATNNWIILLEAGTIVGPKSEKLRVAKATLEKQIKTKYNIFLRKQHFLVLEGYDPRIHAVYFCPQLYKFDGHNNLVPLEGEEIGQLVAQSVQDGVVEKQPWYEALEKLPSKPILEQQRIRLQQATEKGIEAPTDDQRKSEGTTERQSGANWKAPVVGRTLLSLVALALAGFAVLLLIRPSQDIATLDSSEIYERGYPSRPMNVVVPFPAGGPSDVVARVVTEQMGKVLGQSMVIENVAGAGGTIGSARVAAAPSDGYTLLAGSMGSHVAAPVLAPNLKYDSERDFAPIGFTAQSPAVIVARKEFPAKNLRQFVDYLKQNSGGVKQAHGGIGASSHMACLLFNAQAGVKPSLVAYRGTAPALSDLIGGHVDFFCEQVVSVAPQIAAGSIKAYAISSSERLPTLPDVPTAKEAGLDYQMSIWAGIFAPKGTPKPVVDKLAAALDKSLDDPGVKAKVAELGGSIPTKSERTPAKFSQFVNSEIARWSPILNAALAATGTN
jgi:tripartite-type tricarboxylate transporter receptor subunit TctC